MRAMGAAAGRFPYGLFGDLSGHVQDTMRPPRETFSYALVRVKVRRS